MIFRRFSLNASNLFHLPPDLDKVADLVGELLNLLEDVATDRMVTELVLTEAINNAIVHGVSVEKSGPITVKLNWQEKRVIVEITDPNGRLTQEMLEQAQMPDHDQTHGRGLPLITQLVPDVFINQGTLCLPLSTNA